jgi:lipopolysaccharide transport system permease protein
MSAGGHTPSVECDANTRRLRISCSFTNRSRDTWTPERVHLGWQLYDPDTDLFLAEGNWSPLAGDVGPAEPVSQTIEVGLPPEKGRYHVYISPVTPAGWLFTQGAAFLLVEAEVEHGRAAVRGARVTTLRRRRWRRRLASVHELLREPFRTIAENRSLIRSMVRRDIAARYRGSLGGAVWTVLNPLLLMLTYFFVFGIVLRARFGGDPSPAGFALYFLAGMLPWLPFAEAVGRSPFGVLEHRNFVKKLVFPIEIVPVNLTLAGLVTQAFALALFLLFLWAVRGAVPLTALWLPLLVVPQVLFTLGLAWLLAALGVYLRDLGQIMGYLLTLCFFLTPICYPEQSLPPGAVEILSKNPIYTLVRGFRACLLENSAPAGVSLVKLWLAAAAVFLLGHAFFRKLRRSFADVL